MTLISSMPRDILNYFGLFLSGRQLMPLSLTCMEMRDRCRGLFAYLAEAEQRCLRMIHRSVPLTLGQVVEHLKILPEDECQLIRIDLSNKPLKFYSGLFDDAFVLIEDHVLVARGDDTAMQQLILAENDAGKAAALAMGLSTKKRPLALLRISQRPELNFKQAFEIVCRIPCTRMMVKALYSLPYSPGFSSDEIVKISKSIKDEALRSQALYILTLKVPMPLEKALNIAYSIPLEEWRDKSLQALVFERKMPCEKALKIAQTISNQIVRDKILCQVALMKEWPLESALQIAESISIEAWKSETKACLAQRSGVSFEKGIKIARSITEPKWRDSILFNLVFCKEVSLDVGVLILNNITDVALKSQGFALLSQLENLPQETAFAIASMIPNQEVKDAVFLTLGLKNGMSANDILEIKDLIAHEEDALVSSDN